MNVACTGIKKSIRSFEEKSRLHERPPRSIRYCETSVEKEFLKYKRLKLGANTEQSDELDSRDALLAKTDALINRLITMGNTEKDTGIGELYFAVCNRIRKFRSKMTENWTSLHAELEKIDNFFINEFCGLISPEDLRQLTEEAEERLCIQKSKMSRSAYENTLESMRNLLVREKYGVMRIGLEDEL